MYSLEIQLEETNKSDWERTFVCVCMYMCMCMYTYTFLYMFIRA